LRWPRSEVTAPGSERRRKMGSTGDSPVPVGDSPTGRSKRLLAKGLSLLPPGALPVPPGESPGGAGQWPVLPQNEFPATLSADIATTSRGSRFICQANKNRNGFRRLCLETMPPPGPKIKALTRLFSSAKRSHRERGHPNGFHGLRAGFKNRPVRGPGLQGFVILAISRRPRALTRRPPTILKHALAVALIACA
jgi:hypothetical protein